MEKFKIIRHQQAEPKKNVRFSSQPDVVLRQNVAQVVTQKVINRRGNNNNNKPASQQSQTLLCLTLLFI